MQDANYQCSQSDAQVGMVTLTAPRVISQPDVDSFLLGQDPVIADESGTCSETLTITIRSGYRRLDRDAGGQHQPVQPILGRPLSPRGRQSVDPPVMKLSLLILAALIGLSAPAFAQRAMPPGEIRANGDITFGNALKFDKREGNKTIITPDTLQILNSGSTGDASTLSVTPNAGTGVVARSLKDLLSNEIYGANYGVVADDGVDDGPAIREAIKVAQQRRARLRLPGGILNVCTDPSDPDALLRLTSVMEMVGASRGTIISPCATAGDRAIILVKPLANAGGIRGMILRDFQIGASLGAMRTGGDGILVDTTNRFGFVAKLLVENVSVANAGVGKYSFRHVNNYAEDTSTNPPTVLTGNPTGGMFASTVRDCDFFGGMKFELTGDSNNIERNVISGPNEGVYYWAINRGAATHRIVGNNITATGDTIYVKGSLQVKIEQNQLEAVGAYTGTQTNPAVITFDGTVDWEVRGNNINAYTRSDAVAAINGARGGRLWPNSANYGADKVLFRAVASPGNVVDRQFVDVSGGVSVLGASKVSLDAASYTFGVWQQLDLANGWVAGTDANYRQGLWWMPLPDGTIRLAGTIQGGTTTIGTNVARFPAGFRTSQAQRIPVSSFSGTNPWQLGMLIVAVNGALNIQNMPGSNVVQFDGTSFNIRP
ncbi:hypothetical protein [Methylobacterium sp. R2-1]|uniref:hypothetical protein n=1 Tax=Methylobacterium sp. R2-1 TaxID=2587064 RepID=UPI00160A770F|nr:hypothetical protein [Methylobacterium sp. R2-1]MBB2961783.1 hypothetical protein [Methylobacterium sp. R2-1]